MKLNWQFHSARIARSLGRAAYACVRFLVPVRARQIAFVSFPDCADNACALFEYIMWSGRANEYRLIWLVQDVGAAKTQMMRRYPESEVGNVRFVSKNTVEGIICFLRSHYVFFTHGHYWFVESGAHQVVVNLWHGMPIKKIGKALGKHYEIPFAQYSIATSEFFADVIADAFTMQREKVLVTGLPRNEWLRRPADLAMLKRGRSKLVVWLPTYRQLWVNNRVEQIDAAGDEPDALSLETLAELDQQLDGADVQLLVKLHPLDVKNQQAWPAYRNIDIYSDRRFRSEDRNIYKVLGGADALVTDFSSIAIDYIPARKPMAFFAPDQSSYSRGFVPGVLERIESVGCRITTTAELAGFLKSLPEPKRPEASSEELHESSAVRASEKILRHLGLGNLAPEPSIHIARIGQQELVHEFE